MTASTTVPPTTKEQLIVTAERLFALHGIDGVSLRQISAEAGNANNSAVQYHFGSREALMQAIFEHRLPRLTQRRQLLEAEARSEGRPDDLRTCTETYLLPVVEEAEREDSYYLTFLAQLDFVAIGEHPFDRLPKPFKATTYAYFRRASALLIDVPQPIREHRISIAMSICTRASSDRERARRHGAALMPYDLHVADLFDGIVGFLQAPASADTECLAANTPKSTNLRFSLP